jgi:hypothetical protein
VDNETQKVFAEGEAVANYVNSKGWHIVKDLFAAKISDLQSIKNLEAGTATKMMQDVKIRLAAVDILLEIIREVEGQAQQHVANIPLMQKEKSGLEII